jgi:hypothetical protein
MTNSPRDFRGRPKPAQTQPVRWVIRNSNALPEAGFPLAATDYYELLVTKHKTVQQILVQVSDRNAYNTIADFSAGSFFLLYRSALYVVTWSDAGSEDLSEIYSVRQAVSIRFMAPCIYGNGYGGIRMSCSENLAHRGKVFNGSRVHTPIHYFSLHHIKHGVCSCGARSRALFRRRNAQMW